MSCEWVGRVPGRREDVSWKNLEVRHSRDRFSVGYPSHAFCSSFAMPTLATTVDGLKLPNPFVIGSGPPGTNLSVINRAFKEGWGAVIAKTVSLDA